GAAAHPPRKASVSAEAERILELEAAGIPMSRNQHFDLFKQRENRRALALYRQLSRWAEILRGHHASGDLQVTVSFEPQRHHLRIHLPRIEGTATLWLDELEYELLRRHDGIEAILPAA